MAWQWFCSFFEYQDESRKSPIEQAHAQISSLGLARANLAPVWVADSGCATHTHERPMSGGAE